MHLLLSFRLLYIHKQITHVTHGDVDNAAQTATQLSLMPMHQGDLCLPSRPHKLPVQTTPLFPAGHNSCCNSHTSRDHSKCIPNTHVRPLKVAVTSCRRAEPSMAVTQSFTRRSQGTNQVQAVSQQCKQCHHYHTPHQLATCIQGCCCSSVVAMSCLQA